MTTLEERISVILYDILDVKNACIAEARNAHFDEDESAYWDAIIDEISDAYDSMAAALDII